MVHASDNRFYKLILNPVLDEYSDLFSAAHERIARRQTEGLHREWVGTEHLLLAMYDVPSPVTPVLTGHGLEREDALQRILECYVSRGILRS